MAPSAFRVLVLLATIALPAGLGCVPRLPRAAIEPDGAALVADAQRAGLPFEDPTILDGAMRRAMDEQVGRGGTQAERVTRLRRWLHEGDAPFRHDPHLTVDAATAFRLRRGGCMSHGILFVTLARYLGVDAYYVHALSAHEFADRDDALVAMTHLAIGYTDGGDEHVLDIWMPVDDWRLVRYERIDDESALSLYFSNLAVDDLHARRMASAEEKLRFLAARARSVPEVRSNLAAILIRERRYRDALRVVQEGVARFPEFKPLYTNGYLAAMGAGEHDLAERFAAKGRALIDDDPVFLFARGAHDYERGHYAEAARWFERARNEKSDSVIIHAWLVRAYVAAGDRRSGAEAFERAWRLSPNDPRLTRLAEQSPELWTAIR